MTLSKDDAGRFRLNAVTREELQGIPGIGHTGADAIIQYRDESGGYKNLDELLELPGIEGFPLETLKQMFTVSEA